MNRPPANSTGVRQWSRGARLTLFTICGVLTIAFMVVSLGILTLLVARCDEAELNPTMLCSDSGRAITTILGFGGLAAIAYPWCQFLIRFFRIREEEAPVPTREQIRAAELPATWGRGAQLPLGQHLVSGDVESVNARSHGINVSGLTLRFWGGHALRSGSIRLGERAAFVYQKMPLLGLKYVLVFWKGGDSPVQSVGAMIHACFLLLAIVGMGTAPVVKQGYPTWFMPVCVVLFVVGSIYLALLLFAKRALHGLINDIGST